MAVTYGFFNSVNGDRKYNAEQMSEYFRGIINEGVYQHLDGGLAVTAGTGLAVNVAAGRAIIQDRWVQNSAAMSLTIATASETYARKDAVVIRLNWSSRSISIAVKTGTPAASPVAPSMTRNSTTYEMALAYVNVAANATSVTITDKRSDSTVCGWVTVAQSTSGEVDAMLNAMKTGFDGVVYASPAAMVRGEDQKIQNSVDLLSKAQNSYGIVTGGVTVVSNTTHSSTKDRTLCYIPTSTRCFLDIKTIGSGYSGQIIAYYEDGTAGIIASFTSDVKGLQFFPSKNIKSIGIYLVTTSDECETNFYILCSDVMANTAYLPVNAYLGNNASLSFESLSNGGTEVYLENNLNVFYGNSSMTRNATEIVNDLGSSSAEVSGTGVIITMNAGVALCADMASKTVILRNREAIRPGEIPLIITHYGGVCGGVLLDKYFEKNILKIGTLENNVDKLTQKKSFTVNNGAEHSSRNDQIAVNVKNGDSIIVIVKSSQAVGMQIFSYSNGSGTIVKQKTTDSLSTVIIVNNTFDHIGLYCNNSSGTAANVELYVAAGYPYFDMTVQSTFQDGVFLNASEKAEEFDALFNGSESCDSFFFFSDPHLMGEDNVLTKENIMTLRQNLAILRSYAEECYPDTIICGGDWLNRLDTKAEACYKLRFLSGLCHEYIGKYNFRNLLGNHDTNYQGIDTDGSEANTGRLSAQTINNLLFKHENTGKAYFNFATSETMYYCLDTGIDWVTTMDDYKWTQMKWLAENLRDSDNDNNIVAMHIYTNEASETFGDDDLPMSVNTVAIITAYNNRTTISVDGTTYDFSGCSGYVRCILTGHTHYDKIYTADDDLPVICITDATDYGASPIKFDMGFLDYTNNVLKLVRVNDDVTTRTVNLR